jgi:flagellar hook protein FlgE
MDVTGNNIANVNTTGFKAGRVTFEESMAQLLKGATRPPGNAGGTNPMQLGLGMSVGSIDTIMQQGNLQSTGQITDLAIEGRAFFAYSSGDGVFYSRNGAMQIDAQGNVVCPTNGYILQGMMAAPDGSYPPGSHIGNIRIPFGEKAPAQETSVVQFASNLDSDSEGLGTVLHTGRFLAAGETDTTLTSLFDTDGNDLGIQVGDTITVSATGLTPVTLAVEEDTTLEDLRLAINQVIQQVPGGGLNTATLNADGTFTVENVGTDVLSNLQIRNPDRPGSDSYVANAFSFDPAIESGGGTDDSPAILRPAQEDDSLADILDASGQPLGLEDGDEITINGGIGGSSIPELTQAYSADAADATTVTTLSDLMLLIQRAFGLPETDGTMDENQSVSANEMDTDDDRIPDGSIVLRGQPEEAFALTNVSITATNSNNDSPRPTRFISNMAATQIQAARDTGRHSTSIVVYDESGDAHTMTTTFIHSGNPGEWLWEINTEGGEEILGGNRGQITFGQDGSPSSMTFNDNSTLFRFDPMNGSSIVSIELDVGSPGTFDGITQFRAPSTTAAREQDGFPMGKLLEISIDEYGEIEGVYTNGVVKSIARIYVTEFNNPAGLLRVGDSMYAPSNNSGEAVMLQAGVGSSAKIKPGALEMSNVELATEFTKMITTQRGYQANARVITTSDAMLQELVQLVR